MSRGRLHRHTANSICQGCESEDRRAVRMWSHPPLAEAISSKLSAIRGRGRLAGIPGIAGGTPALPGTVSVRRQGRSGAGRGSFHQPSDINHPPTPFWAYGFNRNGSFETANKRQWTRIKKPSGRAMWVRHQQVSFTWWGDRQTSAAIRVNSCSFAVPSAWFLSMLTAYRSRPGAFSR
jgi:hypothetical protein